MVKLSEAGARLAAYQPVDPGHPSDIYRRRDRRRTRRRLGAGLCGAVALAVVALIVAVSASRSTRPERVTTSPSTSTARVLRVQATAEQLAAGRWSVLPPAPIPARDSPAVVWTGSALIVWGGESGPHGEVIAASGAVFHPSSGRWTVLPPAPIAGRSDPAAVWTGTEMVLWGGYDNLVSFHVSATGAAYNPATNTWRLLSASPLSARAGSRAVWTGSGVFILGGSRAVIHSQADYDTDGAIYDPAINTWKVVSPPTAPAGHGLDWSLTAQAGSRTLAWSTWYLTAPHGPASMSTTTGVDLYSYDEHDGQWRTIDQSTSPVANPSEAISAGENLVLRGSRFHCGPCAGPPTPEASASATLNPTTDTWTAIPSDPIAFEQPQSAWTGAAIVSMDLTTEAGSGTSVTRPGASTAYDPLQQKWHEVPPAPAACLSYMQPVWTGKQVLALCATVGVEGTAATSGGIALQPGA